MKYKFFLCANADSTDAAGPFDSVDEAATWADENWDSPGEEFQIFRAQLAGIGVMPEPKRKWTWT